MEDINWLKRKETALMVELSKIRNQISIIEGKKNIVDEPVVNDLTIGGDNETEVKQTKKSNKKKKEE